MGFRGIAAACLAAVAVVGCGSENLPSEAPLTSGAADPAAGSGASDGCDDAVLAAAEVDAMSDSVEDLDPAIVTCVDLADFTSATDAHPAALDGADAETFVGNRCLYSEDQQVTSSAICEEVGS